MVLWTKIETVTRKTKIYLLILLLHKFTNGGIVLIRIPLILSLCLTSVLGAQVVEESFREALASTEQAHQEEYTFCCQKKNFGLATVELLAVSALPWYVNRHLADDTTADLSWKSWKNNIREGFEWDPNSFKTNMFDHPFHGSVYFNAARSNGYSFWGSVPFAFAGSFMWEFFGENNRGAINDWAMTSIGGITLGETLHRTAKMIRDNRATGVGRTFRELGAFFVDPVGGFSRLVRGEMSKVGPNPSDRFPGSLYTTGMVGFRAIADGGLKNAEPATFYADLHVLYGNPMEDYKRPFDTFILSTQINGKEKQTLGLLQMHGVLYGKSLKRSKSVDHVVTFDMMFDYADNRTYEIGGQSFAATLRSLWKFSEGTQLRTIVQPSFFPLAAVISEFVGLRPDLRTIHLRDYDFGSGFGFRTGGTLFHQGNPLLSLNYRGIYTHTMNGAIGNQIVHFLWLRARYPLWRSLGIGVDYVLYMRDSYNRDFPDVHRRNPELRVGASFVWR